MRPSFYITSGKKRYASFTFFALVGCVLAICLAFVLAYFSMIDFYDVAFLIALSFFSFLVFYAIQYILTGSTALTYYRYQIFILLCNCIFIYVLDFRNALALIDISIICIGAFQCIGRLGCFHAGCCHGRPCHFGVVYSHEAHRKHGFPQAYLGVKVLPVQLISAGSILLLVAVSIIIFLNANYNFGSATVFYITGYACFRFFIEFFRGDTDRLFFRSLSEAQLTAFLSCIAILLLAFYKILPFFVPVLFMGIFLILNIGVLLLVSFVPHLATMALIFKPEANVEMYRCLKALKEQNPTHNRFTKTPVIIKASAGFAFSMEQLPLEKISFLYTISCFTGKMSTFVIRFLLYLIGLQRENKTTYKLLKRSDHMAQVLVE